MQASVGHALFKKGGFRSALNCVFGMCSEMKWDTDEQSILGVSGANLNGQIGLHKIVSMSCCCLCPCYVKQQRDKRKSLVLTK